MLEPSIDSLPDGISLQEPRTLHPGQIDLTDLADVEISPYYQHKVKLQQHRQYAKRVASDIISAKTYPASHPTSGLD